MKLLVLGASGPTGLAVTRQALSVGHNVTATTRHPDSFPVSHQDLRVAEADVSDPESVEQIVEGHDAVISAFGVPYTRDRVTIYSEGMTNLVAACSGGGPRRVVCVSSKEVVDPGPGEPFLYRLVLNPFLHIVGRTLYADMGRMESIVRDSPLEWTIVRAGGLFTAEKVSDYRVTTEPKPGVLTSYRDLADALLTTAVENRYVREAIEVHTDEGAPGLFPFMVKAARGGA